VTLVSAAPDILAGFYESALGFSRVATRDADVTLRLGGTTVALIRADPPGRSYPAAVPGWSPLFQHVAIVVSDMAAAYSHLSAQRGWTAISTAGPEPLPAASGGVTAFKFHDPEGHPLELIAFPRGRAPSVWQRAHGAEMFLGIDHSAISIADTTRSVAFYERLGFVRTGGSLNRGIEQDRLDRISGAQVAVTAMSLPEHPTPHVELLCYAGTFDRDAPLQAVNDIAATRLVLGVDDAAAVRAIGQRFEDTVVPPARQGGYAGAMLRDPDGHLLCLAPPGS
jgi:catechol 2,3-dioxygenase-like lactoylglutathione lyase family enzyme